MQYEWKSNFACVVVCGVLLLLSLTHECTPITIQLHSFVYTRTTHKHKHTYTKHNTLFVVSALVVFAYLLTRDQHGVLALISFSLSLPLSLFLQCLLRLNVARRQLIY